MQNIPTKRGARGPHGLLVISVCVSAAIPGVAAAVDLGSLQVLSGLGQPFVGRIPFRLSPGETLDASCIRVDSRVSTSPSGELPSLQRARVEIGAGGSHLVIRAGVVDEPAVRIPLVVSCAGTSRREYVALLDEKPVIGAPPVGGGTAEKSKAELRREKREEEKRKQEEAAAERKAKREAEKAAKIAGKDARNAPVAAEAPEPPKTAAKADPATEPGVIGKGKRGKAESEAVPAPAGVAAAAPTPAAMKIAAPLPPAAGAAPAANVARIGALRVTPSLTDRNASEAERALLREEARLRYEGKFGHEIAAALKGFTTPKPATPAAAPVASAPKASPPTAAKAPVVAAKAAAPQPVSIWSKWMWELIAAGGALVAALALWFTRRQAQPSRRSPRAERFAEPASAPPTTEIATAPDEPAPVPVAKAEPKPEPVVVVRPAVAPPPVTANFQNDDFAREVSSVVPVVAAPPPVEPAPAPAIAKPRVDSPSRAPRPPAAKADSPSRAPRPPAAAPAPAPAPTPVVAPVVALPPAAGFKEDTPTIDPEKLKAMMAPELPPDAPPEPMLTLPVLPIESPKAAPLKAAALASPVVAPELSGLPPLPALPTLPTLAPAPAPVQAALKPAPAAPLPVSAPQSSPAPDYTRTMVMPGRTPPSTTSAKPAVSAGHPVSKPTPVASPVASAPSDTTITKTMVVARPAPAPVPVLTPQVLEFETGLAPKPAPAPAPAAVVMPVMEFEKTVVLPRGFAGAQPAAAPAAVPAPVAFPEPSAPNGFGAGDADKTMVLPRGFAGMGAAAPAAPVVPVSVAPPPTRFAPDDEKTMILPKGGFAALAAQSDISSAPASVANADATVHFDAKALAGAPVTFDLDQKTVILDKPVVFDLDVPAVDSDKTTLLLDAGSNFSLDAPLTTSPATTASAPLDLSAPFSFDEVAAAIPVPPPTPEKKPSFAEVDPISAFTRTLSGVPAEKLTGGAVSVPTAAPASPVPAPVEQPKSGFAVEDPFSAFTRTLGSTPAAKLAADTRPVAAPPPAPVAAPAPATKAFSEEDPFSAFTRTLGNGVPAASFALDPAAPASAPAAAGDFLPTIHMEADAGKPSAFEIEKRARLYRKEFIYARFPEVAAGHLKLADEPEVRRVARVYYQDDLNPTKAVELVELALQENPDQKKLWLVLIEIFRLEKMASDYTEAALKYKKRYGEEKHFWPRIAADGYRLNSSCKDFVPFAKDAGKYDDDESPWLGSTLDMTGAVLGGELNKALAAPGATRASLFHEM